MKRKSVIKFNNIKCCVYIIVDGVKVTTKLKNALLLGNSAVHYRNIDMKDANSEYM